MINSGFLVEEQGKLSFTDEGRKEVLLRGVDLMLPKAQFRTLVTDPTALVSLTQKGLFVVEVNSKSGEISLQARTEAKQVEARIVEPKIRKPSKFKTVIKRLLRI